MAKHAACQNNEECVYNLDVRTSGSWAKLLIWKLRRTMDTMFKRENLKTVVKSSRNTLFKKKNVFYSWRKIVNTSWEERATCFQGETRIWGEAYPHTEVAVRSTGSQSGTPVCPDPPAGSLGCSPPGIPSCGWRHCCRTSGSHAGAVREGSRTALQGKHDTQTKKCFTKHLVLVIDSFSWCVCLISIQLFPLPASSNQTCDFLALRPKSLPLLF